MLVFKPWGLFILSRTLGLISRAFRPIQCERNCVTPGIPRARSDILITFQLKMPPLSIFVRASFIKK